MEEYVITLTNGVRVLNLRGNEVRFTDGTIAPGWDSLVKENSKDELDINVLPNEETDTHESEILGKERLLKVSLSPIVLHTRKASVNLKRLYQKTV